MYSLIKIVSYNIIPLGVVLTSFAFPIYVNTETLWFVGAGMLIFLPELSDAEWKCSGGELFQRTQEQVANYNADTIVEEQACGYGEPPLVTANQ